MSEPSRNLGRTIIAAIEAVFGHASFLLVTVVLLVAAVGLNTSVTALRLHFKKEPVPMRQSFTKAMPYVLGTWVRVRDDVPEPDILAALAAHDFLFCSYVNAAVLGKKAGDLRKEFATLSYEEQGRKLASYQREHPEAVIALGLSYYTGKADTVAHVPERCYIAEGYDPVDPSDEDWTIGGRTLPVRYVSFQNQTARAFVPCNVAYFFHVNGGFMSNSLAVRRSLQNLLARYAYYAKVELRCDAPARGAAANAMRELLTAVLPDIEAALPDWTQYKGQR